MDENTQAVTAEKDYQRIKALLGLLVKKRQEQPSLDELAQWAGLSKFHLQRLFTRWAGISPQRFLHYLTLEYAKETLSHSRNLLDASWDAGLSGPGRLHDLFVTLEAVTPGEFKRKGQGLEIRHGVHPTPFGPCLVALTERGICALRFVEKDEAWEELNALKSQWPQARFTLSPRDTAAVVEDIFKAGPGAVSSGRQPMGLMVQGTNFQIRVWEALLRIPPGHVASYGLVATMIGQPGAARAVGSALAANPVGWLIPCHRVIREMGVVGDYQWGQDRKRLMLAWEAAQCDTSGTRGTSSGGLQSPGVAR